MRHFTVEPGGHTPHHQHNYEHEVFVVSGEGRLEYDGNVHTLRAGDVAFVEPNHIHQFTNPGTEPFQFLCLVPLEFDCGQDQTAAVPGS
ncbi:MAG: cupin domain-containing protein [Planctomycetota bacterium]